MKGYFVLFTVVFLTTAVGCSKPDNGGEDPKKTAKHSESSPAPQNSADGMASGASMPSSGGRFEGMEENKFHDTAEKPVSTFSIDVDTASYSYVRRMLQQGAWPHKDAVRIEEMLNYFDYDYAPPTNEHPFAVHLGVMQSPWSGERGLMRVAIKGKELKEEERKDGNYVFLIDVSGSMGNEDKLPLLKRTFSFLVERLTEKDRIAIVVYAGSSGLVLPPTSGDKKEEILAALSKLEAGGSTNGGEGIQLAYKVAAENFIPEGVNRVILATDGDLNVGVTGDAELVKLVEDKAKTGVFLTALGFGTDNWNDAMLEKVTNKGNGTYYYIDSFNEAKKVFGAGISGSLATIAKDVKVQVEFNPKKVKSYRLVGYENRVMNDEGFENDQKDAGDIGAGHTMTALFELVLQEGDAAENLATIQLRYKEPAATESKLVTQELKGPILPLAEADGDFLFASAVAEFGMVLKDSSHLEKKNLPALISRAEAAKGTDLYGYRDEFIELVKRAQSLPAALLMPVGGCAQ